MWKHLRISNLTLEASTTFLELPKGCPGGRRGIVGDIFESGPFEVKAIIKYFPNDYAKRD